MATINARHLTILRTMIEAGFIDEKRIQSMGLEEAVKLPRACRLDLQSVVECVQAVKAGKLLSYLVEEKEKDDDTGKKGNME